MITYIILMVAIGFIVNILIKDRTGSFVAIFAVAIVWGITHKPVWGFAALGEMVLGYVLSMAFTSSKNEDK